MDSSITLNEFEKITKESMCFTARQMRGLRILDNITAIHVEDPEEKKLIQEITQIKYVLERSIIGMKSAKFKRFLLKTGKML